MWSFSKATSGAVQRLKTMATGESGELGGTGGEGTSGIWRMIDASANRGSEALRVLEDVLRFGLDDEHLTRAAKDLRHDLAGALSRHGLWRRTGARDVLGDVGVGVEAEAVLARAGLADLVAANAARAAQALRSLQESAAVVASDAVAGFESLRYRVYTLERAALAAVRACDRLDGVSMCVLVDGGRDADSFARLVTSLVDAGVRMIQVRDKSLPVPVLVERVRLAVALAGDRGAGDALVVVNDRPDVAVAAGAGGVHLGADDLPLDLVRRVTGPATIVGATAHDVAEARAAVDRGADYLGIGPCFPSATKAFASHAPRDFLAEVAATIALPAFAIGGVTLDRLDELLAVGLRRVAVAAAITRAPDPPAMAARFIERLRDPGADRPVLGAAPP